MFDFPLDDLECSGTTNKIQVLKRETRVSVEFRVSFQLPTRASAVCEAGNWSTILFHPGFGFIPPAASFFQVPGARSTGTT
jgi:hypothetical protein